MTKEMEKKLFNALEDINNRGWIEYTVACAKATAAEQARRSEYKVLERLSKNLRRLAYRVFKKYIRPRKRGVWRGFTLRMSDPLILDHSRQTYKSNAYFVVSVRSSSLTIETTFTPITPRGIEQAALKLRAAMDAYEDYR